MLIWTARVSKRTKAALFVVLAGLAVAALIIFLAGRESSDAAAELQIVTNEDRVAYLQSLGWEVDPEPVETLQFLLPDELEEPYLTYHELQEAQGFDLSTCCGKQVARYTYTVLNYPNRPEGIQANLYLCEEKPVAGDILCAGADGFQDTLIYPETAS